MFEFTIEREHIGGELSITVAEFLDNVFSSPSSEVNKFSYYDANGVYSNSAENYKKFLDLKTVKCSEDGNRRELTNFQRINMRASPYRRGREQSDRERNMEFYENEDYGNIVMFAGTSFTVPLNTIALKSIAGLSDDVSTDFNYATEYPASIRRLYADPAYRESTESQLQLNNSTPAQQDIFVYIYSKVAKRTINVSRGLYRVNTFTNIDSSGFEIDIAPQSILWEDHLLGYPDTEGTTSSSIYEDFYSPLYLFQRNDLVHIRFGALRTERIILTDREKGQIYDFIGLITDVSQSKILSNNDALINITGEGFHKVLSTDTSTMSFVSLSSFFENFSELRDCRFETIADIISNNKGQDNEIEAAIEERANQSLLFARNLGTIHLFSLINPEKNTGLASLSWLFRLYCSTFSTMPVIPDIASGDGGEIPGNITDYGNPFARLYNRSTYELNGEETYINDLLESEGEETNPFSTSLATIQRRTNAFTRRGIWRIVEFFIDEASGSRRVIHTNFSINQGNAKNILLKFIQPDLVQFFIDVYDDKITLVIRKPPFDRMSIFTSVYGSIEALRGLPGVSIPTFTPRSSPVGGGERTFRYDSADRTSDNPLEIRRPNLITPSLVLDIDTNDVKSERLMFDNRVYSWYRLLPAFSNSLNSAFPSIVFSLEALYDDYVVLGGNSALVVNNPYVTFASKNAGKDEEGRNSANFFFRQMIADMIFLIESNQYLPFTRTGTINLQGDRRIKMGTFVRYNKTGEIFYVRSVNHEWSQAGELSRTTTINVSRGMLEENINATVNNYFNIIDLSGPRERLNDESSINDLLSINRLFSTSKVNKDVFQYFLARRQILRRILPVSLPT